VVTSPEKPYVVILGGAKVSDKILLVENLLKNADSILIGGGMAYTFLKSQGIGIGKSLCQEEQLETAKSLLIKAKEAGVHIELTSDFGITEGFDKKETFKTSEAIPDAWESVDIGPKTIQKFKDILSKAKTVVWNGPVGVFEIDEYAQGTKAIAEHLATLTDATVIIGGGDSAAAAAKFGIEDKVTHISTGGGASLELLEGKQLPGIVALNDQQP
ncbi:MAG: phosphoglycerate kinase, partial [Candidatus Omnitrophica bacterium]|nr:phosphoglycerate kinase [Candidatus Omnitrophota bacterium]